MKKTSDILKKAKETSLLKLLTTEQKNKALFAMADYLCDNTQAILNANRIDVEASADKISEVMIDRLTLTKDRIFAMADGIRQVAKLDDPIGNVLTNIKRDNGLLIQKLSVPIGVIAIIYESRPNVTSDAAALCFKSGNVCILRGGKEAFNSSLAIVNVLKSALKSVKLNEGYINLIEDTSRNSAVELMTAVGYVDLLIPRGGKGLIKACTDNAKVPCIETGTGICHIYVDKYADTDMALKIINNAKTSRPSVCNAAEVCIVHKDIADTFLPLLYSLFYKGDKKVEIKGDKKTCNLINVTPAGKNDFDTEFLDYIMAVKVVDSIEEAVNHIQNHSTHHSECIVTSSKESSEYFISSIDSAAVYVNASTRFTDGGEFGLGCEMGISTQKLHARGPMGLKELTTYKYVINGNGQIR